MARPELWKDPCNGSGPGGAKGKMDNRISELRDSDNASAHDLEKTDITNKSHHLFSAELKILLSIVL